MAKEQSKTEVDKKTKKVASAPKKRKFPLSMFAAIGRYFAGSWYELRQVRWPNRRATWGLTLAVLVFTGVFMAIIVGLDTLFELVIKRIIL